MASNLQINLEKDAQPKLKGTNAMQETLKSIFYSSFGQFLQEESANIMSGTSERNLCGRFGSILERTARTSGFERYYADVEYNRMQNNQLKVILNDESFLVTVTCDLILHSRGQVPDNDNLIAIEMKRREHKTSEKMKDRARLRALTKSTSQDVWPLGMSQSPEHVCGYKLGLYLELDRRRRRFLLEEYVEGDKIDEVIEAF